MSLPTPHTMKAVLLQEPTYMEGTLIPDAHDEIHIKRLTTKQQEKERVRPTFNIYVQASDGKREAFKLKDEDFEKVLEDYVDLKIEALAKAIEKGSCPSDTTLEQFHIDYDLTNKGILEGTAANPGDHICLGYTDDNEEPFPIDVESLPSALKLRETFDKHKGAKTLRLQYGVYDGFKGDSNSSREGVKYNASTRTKTLGGGVYEQYQSLQPWIDELPDDANKGVAKKQIAAHELVVDAVDLLVEELIDEKGEALRLANSNGASDKVKKQLESEHSKLGQFQGYLKDLSHFVSRFVLAHPQATPEEIETKLKALIEGIPTPRTKLLKTIPRPDQKNAPLNEEEQLFVTDAAASVAPNRAQASAWYRGKKVPQPRGTIQDNLYVTSAKMLASGEPLALNDPKKASQFRADDSLNLGPYSSLLDQTTLKELAQRLKPKLTEIHEILQANEPRADESVGDYVPRMRDILDAAQQPQPQAPQPQPQPPQPPQPSPGPLDDGSSD